MYIIHNLPPEVRYKKKLVIPAGFIPGLEKMKDNDSLIYPVVSSPTPTMLQDVIIAISPSLI
jgi:hypothetical protein